MLRPFFVVAVLSLTLCTFIAGLNAASNNERGDPFADSGAVRHHNASPALAPSTEAVFHEQARAFASILQKEDASGTPKVDFTGMADKELSKWIMSTDPDDAALLLEGGSTFDAAGASEVWIENGHVHVTDGSEFGASGTARVVVDRLKMDCLTCDLELHKQAVSKTVDDPAHV